MKSYIICPVFSDVESLIAGMEVQKYSSIMNPEYWVYDDHWPYNRERNVAIMDTLEKRGRITKLIKGPKNLGIHEGLNYLMSQMPLQDDDILLWVGPDATPVNKGWDWALTDVLLSNPKLAYAGLSSYITFHTPNLKWEECYTPSGIHYSIPNGPAMLHLSSWRYSFLKQTNGFHQPCKYYGHVESDMYARAKALGYEHCYLPNFQQTFQLDQYHSLYPEYITWKIEHSSFRFNDSFPDWLKSKNITP